MHLSPLENPINEYQKLVLKEENDVKKNYENLPSSYIIFGIQNFQIKKKRVKKNKIIHDKQHECRIS